ncbi:MAG TPA: ribosomal protein L13e [Nitrososphaerales archaeon]|nr:ribosomal protein L13e [Nitrososphaerales archaeon]
MSKAPKKPRKVSSVEANAVVTPTGRTPFAVVLARHGGDMVSRQGRGFSGGEVMSAGLEFQRASDWGLLVDRRRRSVLQDNVDALKTWASSAKPVPSKPRPIEKVEKQLEKVEEEVKKEAKTVKKEAKKVEKKVTKAAKEVEKEAEKPLKKKAKAKPTKKKSD